MPTNPSVLNQLAIEYVRLNDEADRTRKLLVEAQTAAELAEYRVNIAAGELRDSISKSSTDLPITIAIPENDRLLTTHEYGFLITNSPKPQ